MPIKRDSYVNVDYYNEPVLDNTCTVYERLDSLPIAENIAGNVTISTDVRFGTNSVSLDNGSVRLGNGSNVLFGLHWELGVWIKFTSTSSTPVLLLESAHSIECSYSVADSEFTLREQLTSSLTISRRKSLNISPGWHYLRIRRSQTNLTVEVDFTQSIVYDKVYQPVRSGSIYLGKNIFGTSGTGQFKIQSALFKTSDKELPDFERNIQLHERYYQAGTKADYIALTNVLTLPDRYERSVSVYPKSSIFTYVSKEDDAYKIAPSPISTESLDNPRGLRLDREALPFHYNGNYSIDCTFKLSTVDDDLVIYENYNGAPSSGDRLSFDGASKKLTLRYQSLVTVTAILPLVLEADKQYRVVTVRHDTSLIVYINGINVYQAIVVKPSPVTLAYRFNFNQVGINNQSTTLYLYRFSVKSISAGYLPYYEPASVQSTYYTHRYEEPFRLHQIDTRIENPTAQIRFDIPGTVNITPGESSVNIPVTQQYFGQDVSYTCKVLIPSPSGLDAGDFTVIPQFTLSAGQVLFNLSVNSAYFNKFKRGSYFYLEITNPYNTQTTRVSLTNVPDYNLTTLRGNGHIDSFLALYGWGGWAGGEASGNGQYLSDSVYGYAYQIADDATALTTLAPCNNVRTIFLAYHETELSPNRVYVGGPGYTFNGGIGGQILGPLITNSDEWLSARQDTGRYKNVALSANGQRLVRSNETSQNIEVLTKAQGWTVPVTNLTTNLQSPSTIDSASIAVTPSGNYACIGFPNANNGEGVVQVFNLTTNTKDLHLGSPVPTSTTGGFGLQVAITSDGNTVYASEPGTNKLYVYRKAPTWSATPLHTFIYTSDVIQISTFSNFLIVVTSDRAAHLYEEATAGVWTVLSMYGGSAAALDAVSPYFYIHDDVANTLRIYSTSNTTTPLRTIPTLGYVKVAINNGSLLISEVDNSTLRYYTIYSSTSPITLSSTVNDYGIFTSMAGDSLVVTDYDSICDIYTSDSIAYGERVSKVHLNGVLVDPLTTVLSRDNIHILCFTTSLPMSINQIGSGQAVSYGASSLKGLLLGAFFHSQVFSEADIIAYTDKIQTLLGIRESALIE